VVSGFGPPLKEIVYQIVVERSKGAHLWDLDGNRYVDATNGFGMSLLGWQPDFVLEAVRRQLEAGYDIGATASARRPGRAADVRYHRT
jgi:glutamate-1-semialdehyde aminotransferase